MLLFPKLISILTLTLICSLTHAQSNTALTSKRETYIGLNSGISGFQDSRFFNTTFKGPPLGLELGSRYISANSIRGFSMNFRAALENSNVAPDNTVSMFNLGLFSYEYLRSIKRNLYLGGELDLLDIYLHSPSNLPNSSSITVNNTLSAKLAYRKTWDRGWTFQSGLALGLLSLHRVSNTATFIEPIKVIEKGKPDVFTADKRILSLKHFSFRTLGKLNKFSWRNELYRNRLVFSYTWDMLNYNESGKSVTYFSHIIGLRWNIVSKQKS